MTIESGYSSPSRAISQAQALLLAVLKARATAQKQSVSKPLQGNDEAELNGRTEAPPQDGALERFEAGSRRLAGGGGGSSSSSSSAASVALASTKMETKMETKKRF